MPSYPGKLGVVGRASVDLLRVDGDPIGNSNLSKDRRRPRWGSWRMQASRRTRPSRPASAEAIAGV